MKVLVLAGPTASGKTELLDRVFGRGASDFSGASPDGAPRTGAEVISADSMQAYRGMDIGTAKPGPGLLSRLPHHLIDIKEPGEQYTAGEFVARADDACARVAAAGLLPVVSGGTGFYLRNFICGLPAAPPADPALRGAVLADLERMGIEALRAELAAVDPGHAARIGKNDAYRVTRAVEILRATGRPPADFAASGLPRGGYDFLVLGVSRPREELYARIDARVEAMFAAGLPSEVAALVDRGFGMDAPGMAAIGYREFLEMRGAGLPEIAAAVKADTRRYAKRQMTFFRNLPGIEWIEAAPGALVPRLARFLRTS